MNMIRTALYSLLSLLLLSGCVHRHGISAKYYDDCKEYYDFQGYYHKECRDDYMFTYKEIGDFFKVKEPEPDKGNVW